MPSNFPRLETNRFILRQFRPDDLNSVFLGLSHPKLIQYYGVNYDSLEATKIQMQWFQDLEQNGTGIWWAICDKEKNTFLGAGGLNNLDKIHRKAEIGFWVLPDYW